MILTHILVLLSAQPVVVSPSSAVLAIGDAGTVVGRVQRAIALLPALPVRAPAMLTVGARTQVAVRGD